MPVVEFEASGHPNAVVGGSVLPTRVKSPWDRFGSALEFDGVNRGVDSQVINCGTVTGGLPGVAGVGAAGAFTLEARVQTGLINPAQPYVIVGRNRNNVAGEAQPIIFLVGNSLYAQTRDTTGTIITLSVAAVMQSNTKYVIAYDYDGVTTRLYINGVVVASAAMPGVDPPALNIQFQIGRDDDVNLATNGGYPFLGIIDEVRWSKVARYAGAYTPATTQFAPDANTLGLWHLGLWLENDRPLTTPTTERGYAEIAHWRSSDEANDWSLLNIMTSYLSQLDEVEVLYRDQGDVPGWSEVMDVATVPTAGIPWLAQFVGVSIPGGLTDAQQRQHATETAGFRRGTRVAIEGAARVYLTGLQRIITFERDTSPYHLTVRTYAAETPDPAKVAAALAAQKPAGLVIVHQVATGATYGEINTAFTTYAAANAALGTYEDQTLYIP